MKKNVDSPTIGDITIKRRYWGCFTCKSLKNSNKLTHCQYCGTKRQQDRFVISRQLDNSFNTALYICKVSTEKIFPIVNICKIINQQEKYGKVRLTMSGDTLLECMDAAINDFEMGNFLSIRSEKSTDLTDEEFASTTITSSPRSSSFSSSSSSLLTSSQQQQQQQRSTEDLSLDLFHRVMKNGENYAYDGNIGQYVHVDTLKDRVDSNINRDLHYLKFMKREKYEMTKIVEETIQRRSDEYLDNVVDITHDTLKEWKGKVPCSLCEFKFPPSQLLGTISLNTLLNWKVAHGLQIEQTHSLAKSSLTQKYQTMKLCVFCTQFFDLNFSHPLDVEMEANIEFKEDQKEKLLQKKLRPRETPITKLQIDLSIAELYNKKVGTIKHKVLEPLNTIELKKLEEENRRLQYLNAKKKFREYKKRFHEDLIGWKNALSPTSLPAPQNEMDTKSPKLEAFVASKEELVRDTHSSPTSQLLPSVATLRTSTSAGQLIPKRQVNNEKKVKILKETKSNSLPPLSTTRSNKMKSTDLEVGKLESVKEGIKESSGEFEKPAPIPIRGGKRRVVVQECRSFLTALDDVLEGGEQVEESQESVPQELEKEVTPPPAPQQPPQHQQDENKDHQKKKNKPEWTSDLNSKTTTKVKEPHENPENQMNGPLKKKEKITKLVNSAKQCYSQEIETDVPQQTHSNSIKRIKPIDTSYTKRRRNRLDPRNNIKMVGKKKIQGKGNHKTKGKGKGKGKGKQSDKKITAVVNEEVLKKIEETVTDPSIVVDIPPERAVEMLEKHQRPNLAQVKRLKIGNRVEKQEILPPANDSKMVIQETKTSEEEEISENTNQSGDEKDKDGNYEDDIFDSAEEDLLVPSQIVESDNYYTDHEEEGNETQEDDEEYKDDDDEFEEDLEQSPVRIALNSSAKLFNISPVFEEPDLGELLNSSTSRPSTRREKGSNRSGDNNDIPGIELLSSGTQRIGSASNSRRSSRKLPPFENTNPLILLCENDPRPQSRNAHTSLDISTNSIPTPVSIQSDLPVAITPSRVIASSPVSHNPLNTPSTHSPLISSCSLPNFKEEKRAVDKLPFPSTRKQTILPSNFNFIDNHQSTSTSSTSQSAHSTADSNNSNNSPHANSQVNGSGGTNVDSKTDQKVMKSGTGMRFPTSGAIPVDQIGSPTLLDMNILKNNGQVRRTIKREDSFEKLTKKIVKSLRQSSMES